jgi:hypothetical protein
MKLFTKDDSVLLKLFTKDDSVLLKLFTKDDSGTSFIKRGSLIAMFMRSA